MRRTLVVVFAVLAAVLVATGQPAAAANVSGSLAVASQHTDAQDFQNASELTNTTVEGSGTSANVTLATTYNPVDDEGGGNNDVTAPLAGDDVNNDTVSTELQIEPGVDGEITALAPDIGNMQGSDYGFVVDIYIVEEGTDGSYGEGTLVKSGWDPDFAFGTQRIELDTAYPVSSGSTYTVEFVTQSTDSDGNTDWIEIQGDSSASTQWYTTNAGGFTDRYPDVAVSIGGLNSGTYVSPTHDAERVAEGFTNLTLQNAAADVTWSADTDDDGTFETDVASATYTTSGNKTLALNQQDDDWRVEVVFRNESGSPTTAKLHDEGLLFDPETPSGANPDPTGEATSYDGDISLDVSDADFGTPQGDVVEVTANNSDGQIGSTTISSNQTVSFSYSPTGGANNITWTLTDSYGETTTVQQDFTAPGEVRILNESDPDQLVDLSNESARVEFYFDVDGDPMIVTKNATNGTVDMTGLPSDRPFTIVVGGGGEYVQRRIFVQSLLETQEVYLLPTNATRTATAFDVSDYSGSFDQSESALLVQRGLNGTWQTVEGDLIGANEQVNTQLAANVRHRIVVVNAITGERQVLGPFTPISSGTQSIEITGEGSIVPQGLDARGVVGPDIGQLAARQTTITGTVRAQSTTIDNATLTVTYVAPNGSTTDLAESTIQSAGDIQTTVDLSNRDANGTVRGVLAINASAGVASATRTWDLRPDTTQQYALLATLGRVPNLLPATSIGPFQTAVALLATLLVTASAGATFRLSSESVATVLLIQLGGWAVLGWLPYTIPFAAAMAAIGVAAVRRGL